MNPKNPLSNASGYPDPTAYYGMQPVVQQEAKQMQIIHNLIVQGGVDEDVIRALDRKEDAQDSLLSALKVKVKSAREAVQ